MDDRRNDLPPPPPGPSADEPGAPSLWAPPDAAASYERTVRDGGTSPHLDVEVEASSDGPPPPPFVRQRRRRRRNVLIAFTAVVVIGTPVGLAIAGGLTTNGDEAAEADDDAAQPDADAPGDGPTDQEPPSGDAEVAPLDLDALDGIDAVYGQLLTDIDASERTMIAFQDDIRAIFQGELPDPDSAIQAISTAAGERRAQLLDIRSRLADGLTDDGAEAVRETYVVHLDSWADYMAAIEENPELLVEDDGTSPYTVHINATADAFARSLEDELPDGVDDEVRRFADGILDRGFRSTGDSNV